MSVDAHDLKRALRRLDRAIEGLPLEEALSEIDRAINDPANHAYKPHFVLRKAEELRASGCLHEAAVLLDDCASAHDDLDSVSYLAGEHWLELGEFARALLHLNRCLQIAESTGDPWYEEAARFLRAYCAARLGLPDQARQDLSRLPDDGGMPWVNVYPGISKSSIERLLDGAL